jgi:metallo-beta-lactamase class B
MKKSVLLLAGFAALAACETAPATPPVSEATVQAHVDTATKLADGDLTPLLSLCKAAPAVRPKVNETDLMAQIAKPSPPPGKAFDNLYFLGDS